MTHTSKGHGQTKDAHPPNLWAGALELSMKQQLLTTTQERFGTPGSEQQPSDVMGYDGTKWNIRLNKYTLVMGDIGI